MTNSSHTTLYIGVTSDLVTRVWQHKQKLVEGFTNKYNITQLVYYECFDDVISAITREKQLKGGSRAKKIALINHMNPKWRDMYEDIIA